ncbi:MAG: antibiotic biosynthesis monooxygenase [Pyrinomonadaceae bacterium]|nr:antibiotic biosynthesis monooxygenase [Pyrinomonadaceae bacterium]
MFIALYRWRVKSGKEEQFITAWSKITAYYRENWDSLGSRLHRGNDGLFYGYAQWKSAEDREKAFSNNTINEFSQQLKDAIEESFPEVILEKISDYLLFPEAEKKS